MGEKWPVNPPDGGITRIVSSGLNSTSSRWRRVPGHRRTRGRPIAIRLFNATWSIGLERSRVAMSSILQPRDDRSGRYSARTVGTDFTTPSESTEDGSVGAGPRARFLRKRSCPRPSASLPEAWAIPGGVAGLDGITRLRQPASRIAAGDRSRPGPHAPFNGRRGRRKRERLSHDEWRVGDVPSRSTSGPLDGAGRSAIRWEY